MFTVDNDEYMWLRIYLGDTNCTLKRETLNYKAIYMYNIEPQYYKNKKLLLEAFLNKWHNYFSNNPEFKKLYEEAFTITIDL
uniref:Uncharacterized protein n=1 Tax=viral metagenome TaxID=1070528 RepID=A0A6C0IXY9_9ZZZZ